MRFFVRSGFIAPRGPRTAGARAGMLALVGLALGASPATGEFHDGGVGRCNGCHVMHGSRDGGPVMPAPGPELLIGESATEVCLTCHAESYGAVLGRNPLRPPPELGAGNFTFLLEDNLNDTIGQLAPIGGHHAGHSIVAASWGLLPDLDYLNAPGGTFPSDELGCTSCHDPHGNASFRMLRGVGPLSPGGFSFTYPAPQGDGIDVSGTDAETPASHTAYQGGWADWCANCHGLYHDNGGATFHHPADHQLGDERFTYNAYDGQANPTGGSFATAYLPEVPIEDSGMTVTSTEGAIGSSRVMCLSCHRAHATSAPASLRWDPNVVRLGDDGLASLSYPIPNPYGDPEQRSLCVKCHYPSAAHGIDSVCMSCHGSGGSMAGNPLDSGLLGR